MARRKIAVGDCETDPFKVGRVPKPFIWGYFNGEDYEEFETAKEFIEYVYHKKEIIYFHNGGKFDYFYMLEELEPFSDITIINGRMSKFKIGECEFRDSINILPIALSQFQKDEFDYSKLEKEVRHKYKKEISQYLESDCRNLYELVMSFIDLYGVNLTVAGTALKQWGKISEKEIPKSDQAYYETLKKYYYGGRVECFEKGIIKGASESYDINSAYPRAMMEEHPYGTFYIERKKPKGEIKGANFYSVIATSKGALPLRDKTGLNFPHVKELFHVTGWELLAGLKTGTIEIHKFEKEIEYSDKTNFKEYVNHFYEMKKKAIPKSPEYIFAKLFMNSLYGKFAANPEKYNEFMILEKRFIQAGIEDGYEFAGELGKWALMKQPLGDEKKNYYNISTAASITGWVRAYMWENICKVAHNGNDPLYCDTDCIFFRKLNDKNSFEIGEELGQWEKEGEYVEGAIAGKKLYSFINKEGKYKKASKGCNLSGKEIFSIAKGEEISYKDYAPVYSVYKQPYFQVIKIRST